MVAVQNQSFQDGFAGGLHSKCFTNKPLRWQWSILLLKQLLSIVQLCEWIRTCDDSNACAPDQNRQK